jgi:membrane peptidoglycan carboxypeptidase
VGFTPRMSTAVWVGYPKGQIFMRTEYHGGPVAGGTYPAEIWGDYMRDITRRGKCGSFRSASSPPQWVPFNGKYARSGAPDPSDPSFGGQPGGVTGGATGATYVPTPAVQGATVSPPATGGGNGGGGGGGGGGGNRGWGRRRRRRRPRAAGARQARHRRWWRRRHPRQGLQSGFLRVPAAARRRRGARHSLTAGFRVPDIRRTRRAVGQAAQCVRTRPSAPRRRGRID